MDAQQQRTEKEKKDESLFLCCRWGRSLRVEGAEDGTLSPERHQGSWFQDLVECWESFMVDNWSRNALEELL